MGTLTIRNVDDDIIREIDLQAAKHGVSREEELRRIVARAARAHSGDIWEKMAKLREETRGTYQTDSTILLRQDRDSRR